MGGGMKCIKYVLVIFNALFSIFGIVIIAAACVDIILIKFFYGTDATGYEMDAIFIAIGVLIILVAAFGCFSALIESPKMLYIFVACLIVIIITELSVGIAAAALRPQIETTIKNLFRTSFIKSKSTSEEDASYRDHWDTIQSYLNCCGVTGPEDYGTSVPRLNPSFSCCPPDDSDRAEEIKRSSCLSENKFYKDGCEQMVLTTIHSAGLTIIVCGILFCFLEVAGIILGLWLAYAINNQRKGRVVA